MIGKQARCAVLICCGVAASARPAAAQVQLAMSAGHVTLSAQNATVAQILAEWARVGQTKIVNAERATGGPLTLELTNVPEGDAIAIILRSAGGYVLAPRRAAAATTSQSDRILILPPSMVVSAPPRVAAAPPSLPQPRPFAVPQPSGPALLQPPPNAANDDNDDAPERPAAANANAPAVRAPVFNTFPQVPQQRTDTPAPPAPTSTVTAPVGVSVPGMVVPTPQPAGQQQPGVVTPQR
jgi:hypothetical protein